MECIRLGDILKKYKSIKLVKIDVEGAEYEVLKGLEGILSRIKYIIVEVTRNTKEVLNLLLKYGFNIKKLGFTTFIIAINRK